MESDRFGDLDPAALPKDLVDIMGAAEREPEPGSF
jgi:hypothetical protein